MEYTSGFFNHDGISFHYETCGSGIPFIFLHGLGGSAEQPKSVYKPIEGVRMIALDQRSHGKTGIQGWDGLSFSTLADDVIALADHLKLDKFLLGGISMGAAVSCSAAMRYPGRVKGLALIRNAWLYGPMEQTARHWYEVASQYLKQKEPAGFRACRTLEEIQQTAPKTAETFLRLFQEQPSLEYPEKYEHIPGWQLFRDEADMQQKLSQIACPSLVLFNHQDFIHQASYGAPYAKYLPDSTLLEIVSKEISDSGHKEELNQALQKYLF